MFRPSFLRSSVTTARSSFHRLLTLTLVTCLVPVLSASAQTPVPGFSKSFNPSTIGPGSVSTLQFDISNSGANGVRDLAFSDTLPAGVTIASPPSVVSTCGGTVSAPQGGSTITLSGGEVGAARTCSVTVNVTSSTPGTHTNVTGDLTSDAGNSGSATADLTVATDRPGFLKSFSPSAVVFGGRSRLTLTIDNTANSSQMLNLSFTDNLPVGMVIASPANATKTCTGGTLSAPAGGSTISYSPPPTSSVAAGASCTISVDVTASSIGEVGNVTGELTSTASGPLLSSGKASAALTVTFERILLTKTFVDDPVPAGGTVTLSFTIRNLDRTDSATNIAFMDDLGAALTGLTAITLPSTPCGSGSALSGTSVLSLTGGNLPAEGSCTFSVTLQVPGSAATGTHTNTTGAITADIGGSPVTGNAASDDLFVEPVPLLTKEFIDDPVGGGGSVTLQFTITNTSADFPATDIAFIDDFDIILQSASSVPANGFCGAGAVATFTPPTIFDPARLTVSGASLAAGDTCTFSVTLGVVNGASGGFYTNTTSSITATIDGQTVTGQPASDDLEVVGAPTLSKEFTDDPVAPGDTVTLLFEIENSTGSPAVDDLTFTDDLDAVIAGLVAVGLPQSDVCGVGSSLTGTMTLLLTGGSLPADGSCSFSVTLQVPTDAPAGSHVNTTSALVATVSGVETTGNPASDTLRIAGLTLTKEFIDDPVLPGGTVTLRFTIANIHPTDTATDIFFQDDLDDALDGLSATGLPLADICGTGSSLIGLSGNTLLRLTGGTLAAGETCTFDVTLQVPGGALADNYGNVTSAFSAVFGGATVFFDNAADELVVDDNLLSLTKEFTDDPVAPGDTVTLELTLTNLSDVDTITGIAFTDDLDTALSGLESISGTLSDVCGAGSQITGTSLLSFTGGSLGPGGTCTFSVVLSVPETALVGIVATNTTSEITGTSGGLAVRGDPASDDLRVDALIFTKSFSAAVFAGDTVTLLFRIESASGSPGFDNLSFSDDLSAVIPGLEAVGLPQTDVCGAGSFLAGTSLLTLTDASVLPGGSCSFPVTLQVPEEAEAGSFLNVTSSLRQASLPITQPATATLTVLQQPGGCPDPATIDYQGFTADDCGSTGTVVVFSQQELDDYLVDFGLSNGKVRNVRIRFDPTGQVEIVSPCEVIWPGDGGVHVQADNVCVYGRKRITIGGTGSDQTMEAGTILLVSEEGDAGFSENLTLTADDLSIEAFREAKIGLSCDVTVSGPLSLVSTGELSNSNAVIRQNSVVSADTILVQASRDARLGIGTSFNAATIDLHSTGSASGSQARIRQNAVVFADTLNQTSGNKVRVGIGTNVTVVGNYHLNADGSCSIADSATITAGSTSGNCFNPPAGLVFRPTGPQARRLGVE